jgi:outer membrane protein OmpA-like peptidoglycan-associated protein
MSDDTIDATAHGAGENFPLDDTGEQLDTAPDDNKRDPSDRRVELFFFDPEFGITPPPPGQNSKAGSTQYPAWRKRVAEIIELRADDLDGPKVTFIEMADAHFRSNSAVVLPEGEDPDKTGAHQALTSVGVIAAALRFNEEHPGRTLLVAGHADTTNTPAFNQPLSEERAQLTLAMLEGGDPSRENFKALAQARHTVADIKQILSWAASALPGFDCDPGPIDNTLASATEPIRNFQSSYNANRATIAPNSTDDLTPDGSFGPLTWGAVFDCYEFALQDELGETPAGVAALRAKLTFVDPNQKFLGFSEFFPIEELGVDNFRSQTNRRVEIHFFEQGEEPDIQHALDDPETSDLYLPGHYERTPLEPMVSAKPWIATFDVPTAGMHVSRQLVLTAPELPVGVALSFTISVVGGGPIATVPGVSSASSGAVAFEDWDAPDHVPFAGDLSPGQPFPVVQFEFQVEGGGRLIKSQVPLTYADTMNVQLVANVNGATPMLANQPYVLNTLWGRRTGTTDAQGFLLEAGLPPGGVSLALRDRFLVGTDTLPFGWDRDNS